MSYVIYIEFSDDPPCIAMCDTLENASFCLDGFYVADENFNIGMVCAHIFECKDIDASADLSAEEWRQHIVAEIDTRELERRVLAESSRMVDADETLPHQWWWRRVFANIQIPYVTAGTGNGGKS